MVYLAYEHNHYNNESGKVTTCFVFVVVVVFVIFTVVVGNVCSRAYFV